jgi:hypothetical protein
MNLAFEPSEFFGWILRIYPKKIREVRFLGVCGEAAHTQKTVLRAFSDSFLLFGWEGGETDAVHGS